MLSLISELVLFEQIYDLMPSDLYSLEDLSVEVLTENVREYVNQQKCAITPNCHHPFTGLTLNPHTSTNSENIGTVQTSELHSKKNCRLPENLSNKLLKNLQEKSVLEDASLALFSKDVCRLTEVDLSNSRVSENGMKILSQHMIEALTLHNFPSLNLKHVVSECLNRSSREKCLTYLDITSSFKNIDVTFDASNYDDVGMDDMSIIDNAMFIGQLKNLQYLNVSDSPFLNENLKVISENLNQLKVLDISATRITDIRCLISLSSTLKSLIMHRVKTETEDTACILCELKYLEVLDISDHVTAAEHQSNRARLGVELLARTGRHRTWSDLARQKERGVDPDSKILPQLRVLDMSGLRAPFDSSRFASFLSRHKHLQVLGLLITNASWLPEILELTNIRVAGEANHHQLLFSLELYSKINNREPFVSRALFNIFSELHDGFDTFVKPEINKCLQHVVEAVMLYSNSLSVQMAGTACLYNMCKLGRSKELSKSQMKDIVESCLSAASNHPDTLQLHKNVWLTLCNDYVLQSSALDMPRCCQCALQSMLMHYTDQAVTRMTVAVISILAAKIPTEQTVFLGSNPRYMKHLIELVNDKTEKYKEQQVQNPGGVIQTDITLKFTLSALWNLTDESPKTCGTFLELDGLSVVLNALETFQVPSIQTKVLGLLNNVAEVSTLKDRLINEKCLTIMLNLMACDKIDVSYFSAGIVAHLCHDKQWHFNPAHQDCLQQLENTILNWNQPETEMVAYRSFTPFFPLLKCRSVKGVRLWAMWAIKHVCGRNPKRYVSMFVEQGGKEAVENILGEEWNEQSGVECDHAKGVELSYCKQILQILNSYSH